MRALPSIHHPRIPIRMRIRNDISARIRDGRLPPGSRVAAVRDVAREYGVTLRTVAQAYEMLRAEGLIATYRGIGTFVLEREDTAVQAEALLCIHPSFLSRQGSPTSDQWPTFERLRGMMNGAHQRNISLQPLSSAQDFLPERHDHARLAVLLFDHNYEVDGFGPVAEYALEHDLPICVVKGAAGRIPSIDNNRARAFENAAAHLLALGHRRIALLNSVVTAGARDRSSAAWQQRQGYLSAMDRAGLDPIYVEARPPETHGPLPTLEAMEALLARSPAPTALLCNNDVRAFIALEFLKTRGVRVPEDVSVVGCDNRPQCRFSDPPLTTLDTSPSALGEEAVAYLANRLAGRNAPPVELVSRLVIRASTGKPPDAPSRANASVEEGAPCEECGTEPQGRF